MHAAGQADDLARAGNSATQAGAEDVEAKMPLLKCYLSEAIVRGREVSRVTCGEKIVGINPQLGMAAKVGG